ncbi:hypothetical protein P691DRAFT_785336 [Macrolepiota fuliginosa MF-IS2]|uniref:Uncharacterized protein n=1 Tax=Macrolepiota fuliginosa MF-IS2 TaxID=1400762 RepID=A0A9P6BVF8_9AGAR|nr:hypothetical protein P691DRAFT_785336 [Macrolepiota fuliginosa MF-IS2]
MFFWEGAETDDAIVVWSDGDDMFVEHKCATGSEFLGTAIAEECCEPKEPLLGFWRDLNFVAKWKADACWRSERKAKDMTRSEVDKVDHQKNYIPLTNMSRSTMGSSSLPQVTHHDNKYYIEPLIFLVASASKANIMAVDA